MSGYVAAGPMHRCYLHQHYLLLDTHPDWLDAACDVRNAFNALRRREFFAVIASSFPDLLPWISTMYSSPTELYFRTEMMLSPPSSPGVESARVAHLVPSSSPLAFTPSSAAFSV